jgi:hypothetical protein
MKHRSEALSIYKTISTMVCTHFDIGIFWNYFCTGKRLEK